MIRRADRRERDHERFGAVSVRAVTRREVITAGLLLPAVSLARHGRNDRLQEYLFALGVASGDPSASGVVLWTRLVQDPYDTRSLSVPIAVRWALASDERLRRVVRRGEIVARPERAHAIHVEVDGLEPDREYYYRFTAEGHASRVGRTRTLPARGSKVDHVRMALTSCQNTTEGYFVAYRDMVQREPHLVLHTGDYIYERGLGTVRRHPVADAISLEDYRALHAHYKLDSDLQLAHARLPWLTIWDDHEVVNDWGAGHSYVVDSSWKHTPEAFERRKSAAIQAYLEHMPFRLSARMQRQRLRMHARVALGDLLELNLLDVRQYRDAPRCGPVETFYRDRCDAADADALSMLGREQEDWLSSGFGTSGTAWNVIVQGTALAPFDHAPGDGARYQRDGWDNYIAARRRLLRMIDLRKPPNPVSLGGDIHAYYAGHVHADPYDARTRPLLAEFVTTSLSAFGGGEERYTATTAQFSENAFARFFDNRWRGYTLCDVTPRDWRTTLRVVDDVTRMDSGCRTLCELAVPAGKVEIESSSPSRA
jgi:alkaline phosphatase D